MRIARDEMRQYKMRREEKKTGGICDMNMYEFWLMMGASSPSIDLYLHIMSC